MAPGSTAPQYRARPAGPVFDVSIECWLWLLFFFSEGQLGLVDTDRPPGQIQLYELTAQLGTRDSAAEHE